MKHLGDITKINGAEVPIVDIICGGSPCQDLSVAGKRAGLDGERSGLFMEQVRIVKEQRDECIRQLRLRGADIDVRHIKPRYLIWENVPGAFSSNKGEDFRCVLEEFCRIADKTATVPLPEKGKWSNSGCIMGDGWSVAWRVHDSQFWGVPQRRRRISVIGDFGGESAPEILFERTSLSGDIEPSKQEREATSDSIGDGTKAASNVFGDEVIPTLVSRLETPVGNTQDGFNVISFQERAGCPGGGKGILIQNEKTASLRTATNQSILTIDEKMGQTYVNEELGNTLSARDYKQPQAVCYGMDNERRRGVDEFVEQSPTVTSRAGTGGNNVPVVIEEPILLESNQNHATIQTDGVSTALPASMGMGGGYVPMITEVQSMEVFHCTTEEDKVQTLKARDYKDPQIVAYGTDLYNQKVTGDVSAPLTCNSNATSTQPTVVTYGLDRASFNQGQNAKFDFSVEEELAPTLVNRGPGGGL